MIFKNKLKLFIKWNYIFLAILNFSILINSAYFEKYTSFTITNLNLIYLNILLSLIMIFKHSNLVNIIAIILFSNQIYFKEEYGVYSLIMSLLIASMFNSKKNEYFITLVHLMLSSMYLQLAIQRFSEPYWISGKASLIVAESYVFKGLIPLNIYDSKYCINEIFTYSTIMIELLLSLLIVKRLRHLILPIGLFFHFILIFMTNIINWHLYLTITYSILYYINVSDHSNKNLLTPSTY